jgi:3',5'-cyclic-nucleotide phosphodiesterase
MDIRVLGCHGGETPKHKTSSFLLDGRIAIDAGAVTSMLTLEEQHKIETVLVSHAHLDHVRDLATLADNRCQQGGPTLVIAGIPETLAVLKKHFFNDLLWPDFSKIPAAGTTMPTIELRPIEPEKTVRLSGADVTPVLVHHTIDAAGFVVKTSGGSLGYSGDTGPTERFWELLNQVPDLRGILMEISFPDEHHRLAKASGHHTPETLAAELTKLHDHTALPILLYHIKPVFERQVEKQLVSVRNRELAICRLDQRFSL